MSTPRQVTGTRWMGALLPAMAVAALVAAPAAAQSPAAVPSAPSGIPTTVEEEIASAGRTTDTSFCGDKPILLGVHDGYGVNAWSVASFAAVRSEAAKCPNVEVIAAGANGDLQKAISDVNSWVAQGMNALVIIPDAGAPGAQLQSLQDATKQGVTVIPWGSDPAGAAGTDYATYVDWDTTDGGRVWAQWMVDALGGTGKVVYLGGPAGVAVGLQELDGINEVFAQNPGMELLTGTTDYAVTNWDPATAQQAMTALLNQFPQIDGVISNYGTDADAAVRAFQAAGRELVPMATLEANALACSFDELKAANPKYELATISSRNWLGRIAARKAIAGAQGIANDEPSAYKLPLFEDTLNGLAPQCDPSLAPDQYLSNQLTADDLATYGTTTQ
jgi:ribose transport system substrate-binding protein